jgi:hypothetical protein
MTFHLSAFHPELMRAAQEDRAGAQRDAALLRARQAIEAAQLVVNEVHASGVNLVDAQAYLEYARDAVSSEEEA